MIVNILTALPLDDGALDRNSQYLSSVFAGTLFPLRLQGFVVHYVVDQPQPFVATDSSIGIMAAIDNNEAKI
jgi:hypothetical protein